MDMKEANMIINERLEIKIIDFGISIPARCPVNDEPYYDSFGSAAYMSPELYNGTG